MFGCLIPFLVFIFVCVLILIILPLTGVVITFGLLVGLLAKLLIPFVLIVLGIKLINRNK